MFDASRGCFYAGTVPAGTGPGRGIDPTGPARGNDVVNRFDFLDSNSFAWLAMARSPQYRAAVPWSSVVSCLGQFQTSVTAAGLTFSGYSITRAPVSGANGVAWEFTGQAAAVIALSGGDATALVDNLRTAQAKAPFADQQGLVAATLQAGDTLPPLSQCLDTPFQCIPERVGIAATAWAIFAERGDNPLAPSPLLAAVLPSSRSVQVGRPATAFATILNVGNATATACAIVPLRQLPVSFVYQTTDPRTNALTGSPNTAIDIAPVDSNGRPGSQTFVIGLTPTAAFAPVDVSFSFGCSNATPAPIASGLNTLLLSASATPVPDIVALAATTRNDGILHIPGPSGQAAFAVATINLGAGGPITATIAGVPTSLTITLCQTDPKTAQCLGAQGKSVTTTINTGATPTFSIFATAKDDVPFDPTYSRISVQFSDSGGAVRGSTSAAVTTE
jgi:hypothetical protein